MTSHTCLHLQSPKFLRDSGTLWAPAETTREDIVTALRMLDTFAREEREAITKK